MDFLPSRDFRVNWQEVQRKSFQLSYTQLLHLAMVPVQSFWLTASLGFNKKITAQKGQCQRPKRLEFIRVSVA